jgi:hypothetical protein
MTTLIGVVLVLHGLVHFWFVVLSRGWVAFQPEMGWTGESWLLTNLLSSGLVRNLASVLYSASALAFLVGAIGLAARQAWSSGWIIAASLISTTAIVIFWDGSFRQPVEKGLIGLLISVGIIVAWQVAGWPSSAL